MTEPVDDPVLRALFVEEMRRHVMAFLRARGDVASRARALHSMRGAAAMMGLTDVAGRLAALEAETRAGDVDAATDALGALGEQLRAVGFEVEGFADAAAAAPPGGGATGPLRRHSRPGPAAHSSDRPSFDPEVLAYFFSEGRMRLEKLAAAIGALSRGVVSGGGGGEVAAASSHASAAAHEALDEAFRHVHAIKGAAATVGLNSIARGAHALEAALVALKSRTRDPGPGELDVLETSHAHLAAALAAPALAPVEVESVVAVLRAAGLVREHDLSPLNELPRDRAARAESPADVIRVPVTAVAGLGEQVGEVGFVGDRIGLHAVAVRDFARVLAGAARALEEAIQRIGPPRPWGAPADALEKLATVARAVTHAAGELDREGERLGHDAEVLGTLAGGAREALQRLEASTARWVFDRVVPAAEALARREGKELHVVRQGDEVGITRGVAERLVEPLTQLVRNAVTHGVEPPATRMARHKPARATLRLLAVFAGERVRIVVEDDGVGVDEEAIERRARALGLLGDGPPRAGDRRALLAAVFLPGVSTRTAADAAAGRGVGLDLVQREIAQLGGTITVNTERGRFTRFEIEIPTRPIGQRMLVVLGGGQRFALPLDRVVRVVGSPDDAPAGARVASLARALRAAEAPRAPAALPREHVLLRTAHGALALAVDGIDRAREFVVRPLPPLLAGRAPWSAATVDGEGRVTLVLDVDALHPLAPRDPPTGGMAAKAPGAPSRAKGRA